MTSMKECSHKLERYITTGPTFNGRHIGAWWCPECGAIRNEDNNWILPRYMRGEFDMEHAEDYYEEHINELQAEIPPRAASRQDIAEELVRSIEEFKVPLDEAKNNIRRKYGIRVKSSIVDGEEDNGHCPNCGFAYADCTCDDLFGDLSSDVEDIQSLINVYVGDEVLLKELKTLRHKGIKLAMAKESLIAKYTQSEEERKKDGNPCGCGVEYTKQGIVWWCPGCKQNYVVE